MGIAAFPFSSSSSLSSDLSTEEDKSSPSPSLLCPFEEDPSSSGGTYRSGTFRFRELRRAEDDAVVGVRRSEGESDASPPPFPTQIEVEAVRPSPPDVPPEDLSEGGDLSSLLRLTALSVVVVVFAVFAVLSSKVSGDVGGVLVGVAGVVTTPPADASVGTGTATGTHRPSDSSDPSAGISLPPTNLCTCGWSEESVLVKTARVAAAAELRSRSGLHDKVGMSRTEGRSFLELLAVEFFL